MTEGHGEIMSRLPAFLDEDLDTSEFQDVEAHLESCADCRRELEALRETLTALRALPPVTAPPDLAQKVRSRIRRSRPAAPVHFIYRLQPEVAAAAALAIIVGATVAVGSRWLSPEVVAPAPTDMVTGLASPGGSAARSVVLEFDEAHKGAAGALVAAAADLGALQLDPHGGDPVALRPGEPIPARGVFFLIPEPALSLIVPEGLVRPMVTDSQLTGDGGEDGEMTAVSIPDGWLEVQVRVR